ncbi:MAG: PQQ-binding-like beta-propeller repeat protein, partial [Acidobacteria bacterium]|nr:PQQ-binding-like beta-propeller repeat protein [Acidobacteriota bacterium]
MHGFIRCLLVLGVAGPAAFGVQAQTGGDASGEWSYFGGTRAFTRYAPLDQIDRSNVSSLRVAWRRPAVDASVTGAFPELEPSGYLRSTPILVDGVLYASNAVGLVEAFDPGTGETLWLQDPPLPTLEGVAGRGAHGVAFWSDGADRRIFAFRNRFLYALDADSGEPVAEFGDGGRVDLTPEGARSAHGGASPIVVGDVVVAAGTVDGAGDSGVRWRGSAPENVRGYDVRTGALRWTFHVVPRPGEFGADSWGADSLEASGDLGSWCCLSADPELGHVYVPLTAPTAAYYGGHRPGDNLFSNSLVALDAATGERVWHFQMVHHDLWEYDTVGPPTLGEITVGGRGIRAVMQPSKTGFLYVFDRV